MESLQRSGNWLINPNMLTCCSHRIWSAITPSSCPAQGLPETIAAVSACVGRDRTDATDINAIGR